MSDDGWGMWDDDAPMKAKEQADDAWYTAYYGDEPPEDWDDDADDASSHNLGCQCETCLQNHPEWRESAGGDDEHTGRD